MTRAERYERAVAAAEAVQRRMIRQALVMSIHRGGKMARCPSTMAFSYGLVGFATAEHPAGARPGRLDFERCAKAGVLERWKPYRSCHPLYRFPIARCKEMAAELFDQLRAEGLEVWKGALA